MWKAFLLVFVILLVETPAYAAPNSKLAPEVIPYGVERFVVHTNSPENPEVPFYVRPPRNYGIQKEKRMYRVLLNCPVYNVTGLELMSKPSQFMELADERGWFIIIPTFKHEGDYHDRKTCYYYPEKFSGKAVLDALDLIKKKYPICTDRLFLQGYSGGGQFVHRFALWAPDRVEAVIVNSTSWFDFPHDTRCSAAAWLVTMGEADPAYEAALKFVDALRGAGVVPIFRSYIGLNHNDADRDGVQPLDIAFLSFYDNLTLSKLGSSKPLMAKAVAPISASAMPYVGECQDWTYTKNSSEALKGMEDEEVFLPSEAVAKAWGSPALLSWTKK